MNTATPIKPIRRMTGDATLYRLDPPLDGHVFVVVSAVTLDFPGLRPYERTETYIFPADSSGEITSWGELPGSQKGTLSHERALADAGYEI